MMALPPVTGRSGRRFGGIRPYMASIVKELVARDGKRQVRIFRREDGTFGFESLRFSEDPLELCWIPHGRFSLCIAASEEMAEREARARVDWLRDEHGR